MPTLRHPVTGATWTVPDSAVRHWTSRAGWQLVTEPEPKPRAGRKPRRPRSTSRPDQPPAPSSTPTTQGGDQDDPIPGSPTTEQSKE